MDRIISQIANLENLYWAWEKAKFFYKQGDIWFNEIEVAKFEANLAEKLDLIKEQIKTGEYKITPIKPIGFPKSQDEKGPRTRQSFWISVRDQVTWLAVVNIIGPFLDYKMPFWSYGNRLYISVFYEKKEIDGKNELKFGWYRHTSKYTYRKWKHSWPLYRRHIAITARIMANQDKFMKTPKKFIEEELEDEREREILDQNAILPKHLKVRYIEQNYWDKKLSGKVYWAGIDLRKFYPKANLKVIFNNFRKYFPSERQTEELNKLLQQLLEFPINMQDWSVNELEKIDIIQGQEKSKGIPTGLFVAGFLANLYLLETDELIYKKLKKEKNIAQFRFVDDHVFLSDDYDNLCSWINDYEKILGRYKTGAEINCQKTEPEELKDYFLKSKDVTKNSEEIKKAEEKSRKSTELDPQFPSPLMTQTLAKVSQIAQTDFELLDEKEEDQLIADIEHLLVTDFPDQELRRDTRVSFAATRLAGLVPRKIFDISKLSIIEEQIIQLEKEKEKKVEQLMIIDKESKDYFSLKSNIKELKDEIDKKNNEKSVLRKDTEKKEFILRRSTFKLLQKAIMDNHEKIRLWTKILEYCLNVGEDRIEEILSLVEKLEKEKKTNHLSASFVYALIMQVLANLLIRSYHIIENNRTSYIQRQRTIRFLKGLTNSNFLKKLFSRSNNKIKFYQKISTDLLKFTLGSVLFFLLKENNKQWLNIVEYKRLTKRFEIADWIKNTKKFTSSTSYSFGDWSWWLIQKASEKLSTEPNIIWEKVVNLLSLKEWIDSSIIALYPGKIPLEVFRKLVKTPIADKYINQEGWLYDVLRSLRSSGGIPDFRRRKIRKINRIISTVFTDRIPLIEWAEWTRERIHKISKDEIGSFDPRVSEWTALEIIRQIAVILNKEISSIELFNYKDIRKLTSFKQSKFSKIHPSNYLVPQQWKSLDRIPTWEDWRNNLTKEHKVTCRCKVDFLCDSRYTPVITNPYDQNDNEVSVINGLGALLLGLLIKSFKFLPFWNPIGLQRAWITLARRYLSDYPVSSRTSVIIASCFSKRNRETRLIKEFQKIKDFRPDEDTIYDPPEIFTITSLINNVKSSQKILEKYQITVQEHQPRQLIPVSLIQLTRKNNPYEEIENE